jgi:YD repeat-containing protein
MTVGLMAKRAAGLAAAALVMWVMAAGSGATLAGASALAQARRAGGAAPACRTGLATYRIVTKAPITSTVEGNCTFDPAAIEATCTNEYSDGTGRRFRSVSVTRYATVADVVDEVSAIPPLQLSQATTSTVTGAGAGADSTNTSTLEYDAQKRLISIVAESRPSRMRSTTTYTAWDAAGRPTMATVVAGPQKNTVSMSYDDSRRMQSQTSNGVTCTQTFDANGNPAVGVCGGSTATTTVLTTQRICKG